MTAGTATRLAGELRALVPAPASIAPAVADIVEAVRTAGDAAVTRYTQQFDTQGAEPLALRVGEAELDAAERGLDAHVRDGLKLALHNVRSGARLARRGSRTVLEEHHHELTLRHEPVARAAIYVPGGRAPYPSTVVMGAATAHVAHVSEIVVCSPPGADGEIHPVVLAACRLAGVTEVYRMGGAHAIAALAHGTETISPVDVIVGPGNLYVQEAKRQLSGVVGIDSFAGPSDLLVIADGGSDPGPIALDLLAQAEHGPGTLVVAVSTSPALLGELGATISEPEDTGAVCRLVHAPSGEEAFALSEAFAPEHLELIGPQAEDLAPRITRAGCVFVGAAAGTAFGDYIVGSNHVLPTNGAARFASALNPDHFTRTFMEVRIGDPSALARAAAPIARAEGFELHARSMEARIRENPTP
jgi:histidinol dehydrogenase